MDSLTKTQEYSDVQAEINLKRDGIVDNDFNMRFIYRKAGMYNLMKVLDLPFEFSCVYCEIKGIPKNGIFFNELNRVSRKKAISFFSSRQFHLGGDSKDRTEIYFTLPNEVMKAAVRSHHLNDFSPNQLSDYFLKLLVNNSPR